MGRILFDGSLKKYLIGSYIFESFRSLISNSIEKTLNNLNAQDIDEILKKRYQKIMSYGLV